QVSSLSVSPPPNDMCPRPQQHATYGFGMVVMMIVPVVGIRAAIPRGVFSQESSAAVQHVAAGALHLSDLWNCWTAIVYWTRNARAVSFDAISCSPQLDSWITVRGLSLFAQEQFQRRIVQ